MRLFWRVLFAALLFGGTSFWLQNSATTATARLESDPSAVRAPATQDNGDNDDGDNGEGDNGDVDNDNSDGEDNDNNDNEDTNENVADNDNAGGEDNDNNDNDDDNDNNDVVSPPSGSGGQATAPDGVPTDASRTGLQVKNGDLTIDLWLGMDHAVLNTPMGLTVTGSGAAIDRVYWWAEGPGEGAGNPSSMGVQTKECGGSVGCVGYWEITPRSVGVYFVYSRVRDTGGREVETVRRVQVASNPW